MRKVFLDDLPHGGSRFIPDNRVNWQKSVGCKLKFIYDEIDGEFDIIDYDNKNYHITLLYKGEEFKRFVGDFKDCRIASVIGKRLKKHKYSIGDILSVKSGDIKIINCINIKNGNKGFIRGYDYECLNCEYQNHITEGHLKERLGCSVCMKQVVKIGINDMWTTNPELAKLLNDPNDGYRYMQNSNLRVDWNCAECGNRIKNKKPSHINTKGLSCPKCSDKISYPEKFTYNFLSQLNINFETQKSFQWSDNKRYDFYINSLNLIIEVHGLQHYEKTNRGRTLEEEQENDRLKESLTKENCITNYIIIDARCSDLEFIKNAIQKSKLSKIFNLSTIDWLECHEFACKSLVKVACNLWNSGLTSTTLIGEKMHLSNGAICNFLKKGVLLGWCDYSKEKARKYIVEKASKAKCKKVICLNTLEVFNSIKEASNKYNTNKIGDVCKGRYLTSGNHPVNMEKLQWMYYDQYIEQVN